MVPPFLALRMTKYKWGAKPPIVSMADIQKAGINSPKDLMPLPWDDNGEEEEQVKITQEEIERMREDMRRMNEKAGTK